MAKLFYFIPAGLAGLFYVFFGGVLGDFGAINPLAWVCTALLAAGAVLMARKIALGCLFGIAVGALLIGMGLRETGQIVKEWPAGMLLIAYSCGSGWLCWKSAAKHET
ncbi:hypothetical protein [Holdemania filiformis]|uniref:hypothetical protein n=1 Tax=Holdemania filiformis TaxID=61171 RepID=UPI002676FD67|nr:hypothetical protein [Holdemania filiformis]